MDPILSQMNPAHILIFYLCKIHFNIILKNTTPNVTFSSRKPARTRHILRIYSSLNQNKELFLAVMILAACCQHWMVTSSYRSALTVYGYLRAISPEVKRPECQTSLSLPVADKNAWNFVSTPSLRLHGVVLRYMRNAVSITVVVYCGGWSGSERSWHIRKFYVSICLEELRKTTKQSR
jgi:hypothetical protein